MFRLAAPDDLVTAVEFDETGQYLAVGDKAGRICIFEGHAVTASPNSNKRPIIPLEYKFYTEFQSHEPEFDWSALQARSALEALRPPACRRS